MAHFKVEVYDEIHGGTDTLKIKANSIDQAIYIVESNSDHEYEIIEIERIKRAPKAAFADGQPIRFKMSHGPDGDIRMSRQA